MKEKDNRIMPTVFLRSVLHEELDGSLNATSRPRFAVCWCKQLSNAQVISRAVLTPVIIVGVSLAAGYLLGSPIPRPTVVSSEDDDRYNPVEEVSDGDLSVIIAGLMEPCKMVRHFSCWCLC